MRFRLGIFAVLLSMTSVAGTVPEFTGSWEFNVGKSKNAGMMAAMKITETIRQTDSSLDVLTHSRFQGAEQDFKTHYDLTGKTVINESPMTGSSQTVSGWDGGRLVTNWTSPSPAAGGGNVVRRETRSLSADGNTMTIESVRGSNPPIVMIFEKKR